MKKYPSPASPSDPSPPPPPRPLHTPRVRAAAATFVSLALLLASTALAAEHVEHLSQDKAGGLGSLLGWAVRNADGDALAAAAATDAGSDTVTAARTRDQLAADAALLEAALATDGGAADRAASLKAALTIATQKSDAVSDADRVAAWEDVEELTDVDGDAFAAAGGVAAAGAALATAPPAVAHAAAAALASACRNNPKLQALAAADAPRAAAALATVADGDDPRRARRALAALSALCLGPAPAGDACAAVDAAGLAAGVVVRAAGRRPWWTRVWGWRAPPPSPVATRAMQLLADLGSQDAETHIQRDCLEGLARDATLAGALAAFVSPPRDARSADAAAAPWQR